jgi:hypothetical protein
MRAIQRTEVRDLNEKREANNEATCESDESIISDIGKINSKTAKKILENREAIQRLLGADKKVLNREGE